MDLELLRFFQYKQGYRYNSDSLLLTDFILKEGIRSEVLDVGSGCGIIGILLKKNISSLDLNLLDIQEENIKLIKKNLEYNSLEAKVFCEDFKNFNPLKKFDFIVSNPPFYRQGAQFGNDSHKNISKFREFLPLEIFIEKSYHLLKPRGILYFCYESMALSEICALLEKNNIKIIKICFVYKDIKSKSRLVLIKARKGVKSSCEIVAPFLMYENNHLSDKMNEICLRFGIKSYDI